MASRCRCRVIHVPCCLVVSREMMDVVLKVVMCDVKMSWMSWMRMEKEGTGAFDR